MKILAILAALVASTAISSADPKIGAAQPSRTTFENKKAEATGRVMLGDRKPPPPRAKKGPVLIAGWAELADATPARFGTVFVSVGGAVAPISRLRLDAVSGTVLLRQVKVHYVDGTVKVFAVGKAVRVRGQQSAFIDLGSAKKVDQIDITTARRPAGEYVLYGSGALTPADKSCC